MKYKVGDKIIIQKPKSYDNWVENMNKWVGKVMTIINVNCYGYRMKEDNMIKCLATEPQTIHIYTKDNETHALLKQGKQTVKETTAKCHPDDEFSLYDGAKLALDRLFDNEVKCDNQTIQPRVQTFKMKMSEDSLDEITNHVFKKLSDDIRSCRISMTKI